MKKGTTSIQNIEPETLKKFQEAKLKYEANTGERVSNDKFVQELLEA